MFSVVRYGADNHVDLLIAKFRVAILKIINMPCLELCGILLFAQLIVFVASRHHGYEVTADQIAKLVLFGCADIRLARKLTANHVSELIILVFNAISRYAPSKDNPADCITSRGISVVKLQFFNLW